MGCWVQLVFFSRKDSVDGTLWLLWALTLNPYFFSIKKVLLLKICMFYKNVYLLVFKFLVNKHRSSKVTKAVEYKNKVIFPRQIWKTFCLLLLKSLG